MLHPVTDPPQKVRILKPNEKGSDVNLAAHLLLDGFKKDEKAIVVSNDADIASPIQMVRDELKLQVGVAFPCMNSGRHPTKQLKTSANFYLHVVERSVKNNQLPDKMRDGKGEFSKPPEWA